METVLEVRNLQKSYGATEAVRGVSFELRRGEIFGMVGPNGAGKTTAIECLEGLRRPTSGDVRVLGLDPQTAGPALLERLGLQLQQSAIPDRMKVWEALDLFASFYEKSTDWRALAESLGLAEKFNAYFKNLSGGQKQRVFIALALIHDPEVVFLDEISTGLDPQARRAIWDLIFKIREQGKSVFLTTHFMDEAQTLCDRVAIMDHGRIIALDSPNALIQQNRGGERVELELEHPGADVGFLSAIPGVASVTRDGKRVEVRGVGGRLVSAVVRALDANQIDYYNVSSARATLEDVFLKLTGRALRD
ncbi:MAG: ABC transporter ATP-binding protein [Planctomycetes bacterium]|nr:ABC transporter ATP-binding protein [Planctomycetota bacterium]